MRSAVFPGRKLRQAFGELPAGVVQGSLSPSRVASLMMKAKSIAIALLIAAGCASADPVPNASHVPSGASFAVYALSRGKGVPERTRAVFEEAGRMLEEAKKRHKVVQLERARIGLEGETRLCAEFADAAAARDLFERIRRLAEGVELLNVVLEPCASR